MPCWPNVEGGKPGGFDLAVLGDDGTSYRYLAELKWCDVDKPRETLWDAFKISVASRGGLERSAEALARRIRTQLVANEPLHLPDSLWLAKVISVTPAAGRTVDLENRWPRINSPT